MDSLLLVDQKQIAKASMQQLIHTYNFLTGKTVKEFENRIIAERRVEMAMLSVKNKAGHVSKNDNGGKGSKVSASASVPTEQQKKNWPKVKPEKKVVAEFKSEPISDEETNPYPKGSMAHQLWIDTKEASKIPRIAATKENKIKGPKATYNHVIATTEGKSKLQPNSIRNAVFKLIKASETGVALDFLEQELKVIFARPIAPRPHVQKLIESKHVKPIREESKA